jgi:hypothetical protein
MSTAGWVCRGMGGGRQGGLYIKGLWLLCSNTSMDMLTPCRPRVDCQLTMDQGLH